MEMIVDVIFLGAMALLTQSNKSGPSIALLSHVHNSHTTML